jgi:hypothetical protein
MLDSSASKAPAASVASKQLEMTPFHRELHMKNANPPENDGSGRPVTGHARHGLRHQTTIDLGRACRDTRDSMILAGLDERTTP